MFQRLDVDISMVTESDNRLQLLLAEVRRLVDEYGDSDENTYLSYSAVWHPMSDAAAALSVVELGGTPESIGLNPDGTRRQLELFPD